MHVLSTKDTCQRTSIQTQRIFEAEKEKGFRLKEYSRLKSHESLSEFDFKTGNHVRAGLAAYRRGRLEITLPAHYDFGSMWRGLAAKTSVSTHAREGG